MNRGKLTGAAVEDLKTNPLPDEALEAAYKNRPLTGISARLNRKLTWDPQLELIVSDTQAQGLVPREYRKGYEISKGRARIVFAPLCVKPWSPRKELSL